MTWKRPPATYRQSVRAGSSGEEILAPRSVGIWSAANSRNRAVFTGRGSSYRNNAFPSVAASTEVVGLQSRSMLLSFFLSLTTTFPQPLSMYINISCCVPSGVNTKIVLANSTEFSALYFKSVLYFMSVSYISLLV